MNFVFDLDGTICHDGQTIAPEILTFLETEIAQKAEHELFFASARPVRDILPLLPSGLQGSYLIGGNGSLVSHQHKVQYTKPLPAEVSQELIAYILEKQLDYMIDEVWNYSFYGEHLAELKAKIDVAGQATNLPIAEIREPLKILIGNYPDEGQVRRDLAHLHASWTAYPREQCLDILAHGLNKAEALQEIIGNADYVAFGNDHNDLELLARATHSICVGENRAVQQISQRTISTAAADLLAVLKIFI